jgi:hypothetical protein
MKRLILLLFLILSLTQAEASDTLTIRQIYNFDVDDTFDYKTDCIYYSATGYYSAVYIHYNRFIVRNKFFSPNQDTLRYGLEQVYPIDTFINISFTNLDSILFPLLPDTPLWGPDGEIYEDTSTGALSDSREFMTINYVNPGGYQKNTLGFGLGLVDYHIYSNWNPIDGGGDDYLDYDTMLVYYAKGNDISGTPYYNIDGIDYLSNSYQSNLYPNPTFNQFNLSFSNASQPNTQFILTDILDRRVYASAITQSESVHDISKLPTGIYTWMIVSESGILKTGRIVKE